MKHSNFQISNLVKQKQILIIMILSAALFTSLQIQSVDAVFENFRLEPKKIEIVTSVSNGNNPNERTLFVFSTSNMTGITGFSTDLIEENNNQLAITSDRITLEPERFDLTESIPQEIKVVFNLSEINAGNYRGKIILISSPDTIAEVPIVLEISESYWIPLIPLVLGVGANFTLKYTKKMMSIKDSTDKRFYEVLETFSQKTRTQSKWNGLIKSGNNKWEEARKRRREGNYDKALTKVESARKDLEDGWNSPGEDNVDMREVVPFIEDDLEDVKMNLFLKGMAKTRDIWVFIGLTITLMISVISIWQTYVTQTSAFGASPFDYIAAFLFAFASQALLGEAMDLATSR